MTIDVAGQITNDGLNTYTWDDAGRLKTVSRNGTLRATYHYDHKHRRTRKVTTAAAPQGAKTLVYHYDDQDRLIAETKETGAPMRSYLWADATLLAQIEYQLNTSTGQYSVLRELVFELDHLGTPRQARLTDGKAVWRWESDGYGNTPPDEDPDGNGQKTYVYLRFPGQYYDEESGLHYNWHRYYSPKLGRYLSSDPIGVAGGANTYAYVDGNPVNLIDPTGEFGVPGAIAGGLIGGISGGLGAAATGGSVWRGALLGAASGAFVGGTGAWIGASIAGQVALRAATGAVGNAVGQMQGVGDPCFTGVNAGAIAGSALGGALGGVVSPGAWGTKFADSMGSQVAQRAVAGLPGAGLSAAVGLAGNRMGASDAKCGCSK